jgi:ferric-dicitrate binding protein FerR (iron transport regulator)
LQLADSGELSKCGRAKQTASAARSHRRRLLGNAHGHFTTRGRYGSATVRGTRWSIEDRCDGTLTRVFRGTVVVRDFGRHRNVVVHAGHSYLAKARKRGLR